MPHDKIKGLMTKQNSLQISPRGKLWKEVKFRSHYSNKNSEMFPDKLMQEKEKNIKI